MVGAYVGQLDQLFVLLATTCWFIDRYSSARQRWKGRKEAVDGRTDAALELPVIRKKAVNEERRHRTEKRRLLPGGHTGDVLRTAQALA